MKPTTKTVSTEQLVLNENNPRIIKDEKFKKLVQSIKDFPEMLNLRPIVVNEQMVILGGNMRYRACIEAGLKEIPVTIAKGLTQEQEAEFIIKDNASFGDWDWDTLANEWDNTKLGDWGIDLWKPIEEPIKVKEDAQKNFAGDDDYSVFELVMLHENKLQLLDTINKVKSNFLFDKQEDALMEIIRKFNS
jgi:hypothetical protein